MQWCKSTLDSLGFPGGEVDGEDFYVDDPSGKRVHYEAYTRLRMAVREYIRSGAQPILGELKAPPKYSNYKRSRQYEEALRDKGIDIEAIDAEGACVVREDGLPFAEDEPEEDADLEDISVNDDLKFPN